MAPSFFHPEGTATSIIASSHTLPLLAAGTVPAPGVVPSLTILHSWTGAPGAPEAFTAVDCFSTTAPFRSISWSKPSSTTSSAGFVAGGLEDGGVALWDSKIVRDSVPKDSAPKSDEIDAKYFAHGHRHRHQTAPSHHTPEPEAVSDWEKEFVDPLEEMMYESDGRGVVFGKQAWKPPCLQGKRDNIVRSKSPATEDGEAVAFFRHRNRSPVNGLSFNQVEPHLLASAAANRLVVWDLSYTRGPIDSWEHISSPSTNITSVSWSRSPDIIGSSSDTGLVTLFDIRDKLPSISLKQLNRPSSCIQFSPTNEHELVISFSDSSEEHSVWSWDTRSSNKYLWKSCDRCQGTRSLSWSNKGDLILIGTNNSRIIVFSVPDQKVICEFCTTTACLDLEWSHTVEGSFFASFNKKLTAYVLE